LDRPQTPINHQRETDAGNVKPLVRYAALDGP
jgi:hypothetical protein